MCQYRFVLCRIKLFRCVNEVFDGYRIKKLYWRTLLSWKTIFEGHFDHSHGLHGHENTRHSIGHRKSFNLLFYSLKNLHWFRRYCPSKIMRGFSEHLYTFSHTRNNAEMTMICSTRSTREIFWSFLIVLKF